MSFILIGNFTNDHPGLFICSLGDEDLVTFLLVVFSVLR